MDEQIFALQPYGGISRLFASLARQFFGRPDLNVELLPLAAPVINRYVLDDDLVRERLAVWDAGHEYKSVVRYFMRVQPRRHLDIVHNTFYLPHGLASYPGARRIVTVHDMIPELLPKTRRRIDFLTLKKRYVKSADHIICVSEATRDDLESLYGPLKAPISVIHHGVDPHFAPSAPKLDTLPENYLLFVGHRGQYKDARTLIEAFSVIKDRFPHLTLLFVGGGSLTLEEHALLDNLGIRARVLQTTLSDADMPSAYAHATAFVFPSRFEGFGIPVLEAFACGVPTVLARATSLPEVGSDAAIYFTPGNIKELAENLIHILENNPLREKLSRRGLMRASEFTWKRSAEQTARVYAQTLD